MRKGSGTWLALGLALSALLSLPASGQGGKFADYTVGEGAAQQPKREEFIILDVKDKDLREVLRAISRKVGVNIVADPNVDENITVTLDRVEWRVALDIIARETNCRIVEESERLIRFTQPPTISMEFQDADLKIVLDLVAKQSGSNIVIADNVKGSVSLSLREVPWQDALTTIVKTAGYTIVEDVLPSSGTKILRVVSPDSLVQQLETCFIQLKYVRPDPAYKAVIGNVQNVASSRDMDKDGKIKQPGSSGQGQGEEGQEEFTLLTALKQILSQHGSIQYDRVTNSFYVKDVKNRIDEIRRIVAQIDREPPQINVEVKFITTANTDLLEMGLHFVNPTTGEATGDIASIIGAPPNSSLFIPPTRDAAGNNVPEYISNNLLYWGGTFPFDLGHWGEPVSGFHSLGLLDLTQTKLLLSMIDDDENSRIVQKPTLTMIDNAPATIFVGESIPFAEQSVNVDQNGNVTVSLKENDRSPVNVGFTLYLTPHVIPGTEDIDVTVIPKISTLTGKSSSLDGFDRFVFGDSFIDLPRESSQTIVTSMRVHQGHTAVIGGLQSEARTSVTTKVPILSSIPILGHLFTYHRESHRVQAILILITPHLLKNTDEGEQIGRRMLDELKKVDYFHQESIEHFGEKVPEPATAPEKSAPTAATTPAAAAAPPPAATEEKKEG